MPAAPSAAIGDLFQGIAIEPSRRSPAETPGLAVETATEIPGFRLIRGFLTESAENAVIAEIDGHPWSCELRRRVQHYGWRYDYQSRRVDPSMRIDPLPAWAGQIARALFNAGHVPQLPDQVIVNEYVGNQGIAPHIDSPWSFADGVATVSLLETWQMEFRRTGQETRWQVLERRSAAILTGEARYEWMHGIPQRKTEPGAIKPGRVPRGRRISLTFRKVLAHRPDA